MKQRQRRRLILKKMDNPSWDYFYIRTAMYKTRDIKPCKSYSSWCGDCNAVLFRQTKGRFPHTVSEFVAFEQEQQDKDEHD